MRFITALLLLFSIQASAEYTPWFKPSFVSIVLDDGFRVAGTFDAPANCVLPNQVFIAADHPQYNQIYSMSLAALASKSQIKFEIRKCAVIGWVSTKLIAIIDASSPGEVLFQN